MKMFILLFLFCSNVFAVVPATTQDVTWVTRANNMAPVESLGSRVNQTKNMLTVVYDASLNTGATGVIALLDDQGNTANLPKGAIITNVFGSVLGSAAVANSGSAGNITVSLQTMLTSDLMAARTLADTAYNFGTANSFFNGIPKLSGTASFVGPVSPQAGTGVALNITGVGTAILNTASKLKFFIEYVNQ